MDMKNIYIQAEKTGTTIVSLKNSSKRIEQDDGAQMVLLGNI